MNYRFQKKDFRKHGVTVVRCGSHMALIYKFKGLWNMRAGFSGVSPHVPENQHTVITGIYTKKGAIVQAEAAIVGHGPNGQDYMDVSIEYVKWGSV